MLRLFIVSHDHEVRFLVTNIFLNLSIRLKFTQFVLNPMDLELFVDFEQIEKVLAEIIGIQTSEKDKAR